MTTKSAKRRGCLKIGLYIVLALVLLLGVAGYALLAVSPVPAASVYEVDLKQVRQLAVAGEGELPLRLNAMMVAEGGFPQIMIIAGGSFNEQRMVFPVYQVVYNNSSIIVDAAYTQAMHAQYFPGQPYFADKFDRLQAALRQSRLILVTHEHFDHVGGLVNSPYLAEIMPKVMLTAEQLHNTGSSSSLTPEIRAKLTPLNYDHYHRVAPGVVLIKAAGHTPGSQMVYVRLQNGVEYLLVGDVVWNSVNLARLTGRPLATSLALGEDRAAHGQQIRALYNLAHSEPIHLVISHDGARLEDYIRQGLLGGNFE